MAHYYLPDLIYAQGKAQSGVGLHVDDNGRVAGLAKPEAVGQIAVERLHGKALLPGLVNGHSHSFQRLFRGRAEGRKEGGDTFWTWREQMYRAAAFCAPEDLYDVARATFLEMVSTGITTVGEFHYLHHDRNAEPYDEPNRLATTMIDAARSVGLRICLLRTAYQRAGFERAPHPGQQRFYENTEDYLQRLDDLRTRYANDALATVGAAPHSIRAVPIAAMKQIGDYAAAQQMPLHVHISEQTGENDACRAEYGETPVSLLDAHGLLTERTTLVHAIHLSDAEFAKVAARRATICTCPTTERNLGDGILPAARVADLGINVCYGTDSEAQIDLLEDARASEYHLRLIARQRGLLDGIAGQAIGARLLHAATAGGAQALGLDAGQLATGEQADFFTLALDDLALMGTDCATLADSAVFSGSRAAVRDVVVGGAMILRDGRHAQHDEICSRYGRVAQRYSATKEIR